MTPTLIRKGNVCTTDLSMPETLPEAPTLAEAPEFEPRTEPEPAPLAPTQPKPDLSPFDPPWPEGRPEPQPKAISRCRASVTKRPVAIVETKLPPLGPVTKGASCAAMTSRGKRAAATKRAGL